MKTYSPLITPVKITDLGSWYDTYCRTGERKEFEGKVIVSGFSDDEINGYSKLMGLRGLILSSEAVEEIFRTIKAEEDEPLQHIDLLELGSWYETYYKTGEIQPFKGRVLVTDCIKKRINGYPAELESLKSGTFHQGALEKIFEEIRIRTDQSHEYVH